MNNSKKFSTHFGPQKGRKLTTMVGVAALGAVLSTTTASAQLSGFGNEDLVVQKNSSSVVGTNWTVNGNGCCGGGNAVEIDGDTNSDTLILGGGGGYPAGSAFANAKQAIGGFTASFTFSEPDTTNARTFAFVLQNDPRGTAARDKTNGGYAGGGAPLTLAYEIVFKNLGGAAVDGVNPDPLEVGFLQNSSTDPKSGYDATTSSTGLNLVDGAITANLSYDGQTLTLQLVQGTRNFLTTDTVDTKTLLGASNGYVGFVANQLDNGASVTNFSYTPVPEPCTATVVLLGLGGLAGLMRIRTQRLA
jgi:hypothetical protein